MSEESVVENNNGETLGMTSTIISPACDQQCRQLRQFPDGLRVLAVDDDVVFLKTLTRLLEKCCYQVTAKSNSAEALMLLKKDEYKFDIVLTDVQMQEIDGFKLLEAGLELDIPVIMMSVGDSRDVIMKGVRHGARDFLVKPLSEKEVKNIWQHVYRKTLIPCRCMNTACNSKKRAADHEYHDERLDDNADDLKSGGGGSKSKRGGVGVGAVKRKSVDVFPGSDFASGSGSDDEMLALLGQETLASRGKRDRLKWTQLLHDKFVDAVESLGGVDKAVPKKILELMGDVPEITREKVASHLQKFRKLMKKNEELETRNKRMTINRNNNNNNNIRHAPPPPPPPPVANNNNYPLRVPMVGPTTGGCYPTSFNSTNWMAHGANGYSLQMLQPARPSYNPTMMRVMQPRVPMPQTMDLAPPPPISSNFQQQPINPHRDVLIKPNNLGQECFEPRIIQADERAVLDHPHALTVDPICESFPANGDYCEEDFSSFFNDLY